MHCVQLISEIRKDDLTNSYCHVPFWSVIKQCGGKNASAKVNSGIERCGTRPIFIVELSQCINIRWLFVGEITRPFWHASQPLVAFHKLGSEQGSKLPLFVWHTLSLCPTLSLNLQITPMKGNATLIVDVFFLLVFKIFLRDLNVKQMPFSHKT